MNLDIVRENMKKYLNKTVKIDVYGMRNKNHEYYGVVSGLYPYVFTVLIDGKQEKRYLCEFGINIDERIADGVYFVKAVKLMQDILNKPESLEENVNEKIRETTKLKY